jgi:hypothetical protein
MLESARKINPRLGILFILTSKLGGFAAVAVLKQI